MQLLSAVRAAYISMGAEVTPGATAQRYRVSCTQEVERIAGQSGRTLRPAGASVATGALATESETW